MVGIFGIVDFSERVLGRYEEDSTVLAVLWLELRFADQGRGRRERGRFFAMVLHVTVVVADRNQESTVLMRAYHATGNTVREDPLSLSTLVTGATTTFKLEQLVLRHRRPPMRTSDMSIETV